MNLKPSIKEILCGGLPSLRNLGTGWTFAIGIISFVLASYLGDDCFVILARGAHAYFGEHLRVADWKHSILTNGERLTHADNLLRIVLTMCFWAPMMIAAEFGAWGVSSLLRKAPPWLSVLYYFCAGVVLFLFSLWYGRRVSFFYALPVVTFICGVVLIVKAVVAIFRKL